MGWLAGRRQRRQEEEEERQAFFESPVGIAQIAYANDDLVLELFTLPRANLNAVCREGWDLVNGSVVSDHENGGRLLCHYLFKRCEENRREPDDQWRLHA